MRPRKSRWAGSKWMPRNRARPRIITANPIASPPRPLYSGYRVHFRARHGNAADGAAGVGTANQGRLRGSLLLLDVAVIDVADGNGPPRQGSAEIAGELERHAGPDGIVDCLEIG